MDYSRPTEVSDYGEVEGTTSNYIIKFANLLLIDLWPIYARNLQL